MIKKPLYDSNLFQYITRDGAWHPGGLPLTTRGINLCQFPVGGWVLDIGCGTGASLSFLVNSGYNAIGLDCENRLQFPNLPFINGDARFLPFKNHSFNGILCECVLSLLPNPVSVLRNFRRLLKPNSKLLLADIYILENNFECKEIQIESCLSGARTLEENAEYIHEAGLKILYFEDCRQEFKDLAARLLWYSDASQDAICPCSSTRYSYGLWIVQPYQTRM